MEAALVPSPVRVMLPVVALIEPEPLLIVPTPPVPYPLLRARVLLPDVTEPGHTFGDVVLKVPLFANCTLLAATAPTIMLLRMLLVLLCSMRTPKGFTASRGNSGKTRSRHLAWIRRS